MNARGVEFFHEWIRCDQRGGRAFKGKASGERKRRATQKATNGGARFGWRDRPRHTKTGQRKGSSGRYSPVTRRDRPHFINIHAVWRPALRSRRSRFSRVAANSKVTKRIANGFLARRLSGIPLRFVGFGCRGQTVRLLRRGPRRKLATIARDRGALRNSKSSR